MGGDTKEQLVLMFHRLPASISFQPSQAHCATSKFVHVIGMPSAAMALWHNRLSHLAFDWLQSLMRPKRDIDGKVKEEPYLETFTQTAGKCPNWIKYCLLLLSGYTSLKSAIVTVTVDQWLSVRSVRQPAPAPIHSSCCTICSMVHLLIEKNFPLRNILKKSTWASQSG